MASIMNLPPEILAKVHGYLPFPDNLVLPMVCRQFYCSFESPSHTRLLALEKTPYAIEHGLFSCKDCLRLRSADKFADSVRHGKKGKFGSQPETRFCLDCGLYPTLKNSRYTRGIYYSVFGKSYIWCLGCDEVKDFEAPRYGLGVPPPLQKSYCKKCSLWEIVQDYLRRLKHQERLSEIKRIRTCNLSFENYSQALTKARRYGRW